MPQDDGTFYLDTDSSDKGVGAVLSQEQNGREVVLAYASRTLSKPERNYDVTRRELLAVVFGLKAYRQYLLGRQFCDQHRSFGTPVFETDTGADRSAGKVASFH